MRTCVCMIRKRMFMCVWGRHAGPSRQLVYALAAAASTVLFLRAEKQRPAADLEEDVLHPGAGNELGQAGQVGIGDDGADGRVEELRGSRRRGGHVRCC